MPLAIQGSAHPMVAGTAPGEWLERRLDGLRASREYRVYLSVREHVLRMLAARPGSETDRPSDYWREELSGFEYMLDASPLIVEKLRHHAYHITGLKVYDYRSNKDRGKEQFERKLAALNALGASDLLVPESPILGGFGHEIGGALYNIDTLKFYEALIALERGGVLGAFRTARERMVVWEIGAGWGGFAYAFKTLFPDVAYVIVDLPATMLFSGTYLQCAFPEARFHFHDEAAPLRPGAWTGHDFVFLPHTALDALTPDRLDLAANMVSFQEMTTAQVDAYVAKARDLNAPFLYSLNRNRSLYNRELSSVPEIIARHYWPHVIPVLDVAYTQMPRSSPQRDKGTDTGAKPADPDAVGNYEHVVGWRKIA